ncbi:hypothetical protein Ddc_24379 [Ditylenchus destructor]|nr:hypothetical protein Ddc_24379 [Ditylenchus destructor]
MVVGAFGVFQIPGFGTPGTDVVLARVAQSQGMAQLMHEGEATCITVGRIGPALIVFCIDEPSIAAESVLGVGQGRLRISRNGLALLIVQISVIAEGDVTSLLAVFGPRKPHVCHIRNGLQAAPGLLPLIFEHVK